MHYNVIIYKNWGKDSKIRQSRRLTADAGSFALIPPPLRVLRVIAETGESVEFPAKIRNSKDEKKMEKNKTKKRKFLEMGDLPGRNWFVYACLVLPSIPSCQKKKNKVKITHN